MTGNEKSPLERIKQIFATLPEPTGDAHRGLPSVLPTVGVGNGIPLDVFFTYKAAYRLLDTMIKKGVSDVDSAGLILLRDAILSYNNIFKKEYAAADDAGKERIESFVDGLGGIFDAVTVQPPAMRRGVDGPGA